MKAMVRSTMVVALLTLIGAPLSAQEGRVVFLDSERLRREAPGLQAAGQRLQQEMGRLESRADSALEPIQKELQRLDAEMRQQGTMLTEETRQRQQQAIQQKRMELQQAGAQWEQRAAEIQSQVLGPALQQINEVINALRQERGYAFILDAAAGGVIAADPALDITSEVLQRLAASSSPGS